MTKFDMPGPAAGFKARAGWIVRHMMTDLNLTMVQAAGFIGNPGWESNEFKTLQETKPYIPGTRGGYGISQWTGSRRVDFENWSADHNLSPSSMEANYGFLVDELKTDPWKGFLAKLRRCATLEDACRLTYFEYERPKESTTGHYASLPARVEKARVALAGAQDMQDEPDEPDEPDEQDESDVDNGTAPVPSTPPVVDHQADIISAIRSIQISLAWLGYYKGRVDGDWGDQTEDAMCAMLDAREGLERC